MPMDLSTRMGSQEVSTPNSGRGESWRRGYSGISVMGGIFGFNPFTPKSALNQNSKFIKFKFKSQISFCKILKYE